MNDSHSHSESRYRTRSLTPLLRKASENHPVVVLTGARQVGKSTLLTREKPFCGWRYLSLDDFDVLRTAERDPADLWSGVDRVILDEVQRSPGLLSAVKREVDKGNRKMRFVLSGSANLLLMQRVSESLAGRAVYFTLHPMTFGEIRNGDNKIFINLLNGKWPAEKTLKDPGEETIERMIRGFMPALLPLKQTDACVQWWEGYVATYLERDLRQLSQIDSLADFRKAMEVLALRSGQLLNQTEISRDTAISQPTIHRYANLLEASCLLRRLPAFGKNRTKRLIKTPKVYWVDPALASFLSGHHDPKALSASRELGAVFETMVFLHMAALGELLVPRPRLYYWRTISGQEVDFVIEHGKKILAVEVKFSTTVRLTDLKSLKIFLDEYEEAVGGVVVYAGNAIKRLHEKIIAVPWHCLG